MTTDSHASAVPPAPRSTSPRRSTGWGWLGLAAATLLALAGIWLTGGGTDDPRAARARPYALTTADIALAAAREPGDYRVTSPPIDLGVAERMAQAALAGKARLPDARYIATYRDAGTGEEITVAALLYDDPAQAAALEAAAARLLASAFRLESEPLPLAGVDSPRLWVAGNYRALSFRVGAVLVFVGTTRIDDINYLWRLAEAARVRVRQGLPGE